MLTIRGPPADPNHQPIQNRPHLVAPMRLSMSLISPIAPTFPSSVGSSNDPGCSSGSTHCSNLYTVLRNGGGRRVIARAGAFPDRRHTEANTVAWLLHYLKCDPPRNIYIVGITQHNMM